MIRFLRRLLVFLLLCIIPLCLVEFYGTHYLHSLNHYAVEPYADFMRQGPAERGVNTLVMGTSRALVQYNPAILDSVLGTTTYNMGCDGRGLPTSLLKFSTYLRYGNPAPQFIIYDIGNFGFGYENGYEREQFYPYMGIDKSIRHFVWDNQFCNITEKYIPGVRYFGIKNFKHNRWNPDYSLNGYNAFNAHFDSTNLVNIGRIAPPRDTICNLFDIFLSQCDSMNIHVVLVHSPLYKRAQEKISDTASLWNTFRSFAIRHNIPLLIYTDNSMCHDTANFYNATHLNALGADRFSRLLAHDLDSLGLGRRRRVQ